MQHVNYVVVLCCIKILDPQHAPPHACGTRKLKWNTRHVSPVWSMRSFRNISFASFFLIISESAMLCAHAQHAFYFLTVAHCHVAFQWCWIKKICNLVTVSIGRAVHALAHPNPFELTKLSQCSTATWLLGMCFILFSK